MTESKDLLAVLVALHQQAWNIEMERQRVAGEPVSHIRATRAALSALGVAELIEAANAVADFTPESQREKWSCHYGITTAAKCGRCSRDMRLAAALAACTPAKSEGG